MTTCAASNLVPSKFEIFWAVKSAVAARFTRHFFCLISQMLEEGLTPRGLLSLEWDYVKDMRGDQAKGGTRIARGRSMSYYCKWRPSNIQLIRSCTKTIVHFGRKKEALPSTMYSAAVVRYVRMSQQVLDSLIIL